MLIVIKHRKYYSVTSWVYVTRQVTSRRLEYSEFIALALTFTQFTISQLLPSAVSQITPANARLQLSGYSRSTLLFIITNSLVTCSVLATQSLLLKVQVQVTLRLTVSQSVSLGVEPNLGPMTRYLLLFIIVFVGRLLWREDGSAFVYDADPCQCMPSLCMHSWKVFAAPYLGSARTT
jgi:hypothetical protein